MSAQSGPLLVETIIVISQIRPEYETVNNTSNTHINSNINILTAAELQIIKCKKNCTTLQNSGQGLLKQKISHLK